MGHFLLDRKHKHKCIIGKESEIPISFNDLFKIPRLKWSHICFAVSSITMVVLATIST